MLEAANARPRFTISLKRSTQNLQLSTSSLADYPIFSLDSDDFADILKASLTREAALAACRTAKGEADQARIALHRSRHLSEPVFCLSRAWLVDSGRPIHIA